LLQASSYPHFILSYQNLRKHWVAVVFHSRFNHEDVPAAIEKVAKMGYKLLSLAGYEDGKLYGMAPAAFKALVKKTD